MEKRDPQDLAAELWGYYDDVCEAYDETVCTGGHGPDGGVRPRTHWERLLINDHARGMISEIFALARMESIPTSVMLSVQVHRRRPKKSGLQTIRSTYG